MHSFPWPWHTTEEDPFDRREQGYEVEWMCSDLVCPPPDSGVWSAGELLLEREAGRSVIEQEGVPQPGWSSTFLVRCLNSIRVRALDPVHAPRRPR